jgi:thioredoxin-related protein
MKRIYLITILVAQISCTLTAQTTSFAGFWVLKERKNISGPAYSNGIPKAMLIAVTQDSLSVKRTYEDGSKNDYEVKELLALNGAPSETLRTISKRKSVLKKGNNSTSFSIEVTYRDAKTGKQTSADFIEHWILTPSGKELMLEKTAKEADNSSWSMEGTYELKTAEQFALEEKKGQGIQFADNLNWMQVKQKAKTENKFIFVDCYATWCLPCKKMEAEIFPLNKVGEAMNDKYIAVRLQMDTSNKDNEYVKEWYGIAHSFFKDYNIVVYPSYLFFDPNGNIVHKGLGTYKANEFIELLTIARDSNQQYYTLLSAYNAGRRDKEEMYRLIITAKKLGEEKAAIPVLNDYKNDWLSTLPVDSLLLPKYLQLAVDFQQEVVRLDGSKGGFFRLMYNKGKEVDGVINLPGFSAFHVNGIISEEEIFSRIYKEGKPIGVPNWDQMKITIQEKYPKVNVDKLVLDGKMRYYRAAKDWNSLIKTLVAKIDQYGPLSLGQQDGSGSDNVITNILLPYCDEPKILNKAVGWLEQIINSKAYMYPIPMVYGNYGAMLYKAGKHKEGIAALEKHLHAIGYKTPADLNNNQRYKEKVEYLQRMKRGEKINATWSPYVFN